MGGGLRARGCGVRARGWGPSKGTHTEIFVINNRKKDKLYKNPMKVLLFKIYVLLFFAFWPNLHFRKKLMLSAHKYDIFDPDTQINLYIQQF